MIILTAFVLSVARRITKTFVGPDGTLKRSAYQPPWS